jgi:hypothetical protein
MSRLGTLTIIAALAALSPVLLDSSVAQTVGTAGAVNPQAQVGARMLQVGSSIIFQERISTSASGSTQVMFVDKTTLSVGPNSNILIDEFVYNPNAGSGRMTVTLTKGAMRMVGGNVSHTEGATIKTPLATIGVRGGVATVKHEARGGTQAINHFGTLMVTACQRPPGSNAQPPRTCTGASETITRRVRQSSWHRPEPPGPGAARRDRRADPGAYQQAHTDRRIGPPTEQFHRGCPGG